MSTLDRLEVGIDRIGEAVDRLNEIARTVGLPCIELRCWHEKKWHSEHVYLGLIYDKQGNVIMEKIAEIERAKGNKNFPYGVNDE